MSASDLVGEFEKKSNIPPQKSLGLGAFSGVFHHEHLGELDT